MPRRTPPPPPPTPINSAFRRLNTERENQVSLDISQYLTRNVIGQKRAIAEISTSLQVATAGLNDPDRPAGVFFLMGPTGTGKSLMVEQLAAALHGSPKNVLKIHCGEFQMEHEVAKLLGAPPGYLGHRETQPLLSQTRLNSVSSSKCGFSIVLLDEIEKATPSFFLLLLGVMDKGELRLGDNSMVNFTKSLIFMTSNLGAKELARQHSSSYGLAPVAQVTKAGAERAGVGAAKANFSAEFWNRLDQVITFEHLTPADLDKILDREMAKIDLRGGGRFELSLTKAARKHILSTGTSQEYGARELKRVLSRSVIQPLSNLLLSGQIPSGGKVLIGAGKDNVLEFKCLKEVA